MNRRDFVTKTAAGFGLSAFVPFTRPVGANGDVRVAVVGLGNQGPNHINWFRKIPGVRVVAICDADRSFLEREESKFRERNEKVKTYVD